jgi:hypothetical protein
MPGNCQAFFWFNKLKKCVYGIMKKHLVDTKRFFDLKDEKMSSGC